MDYGCHQISSSSTVIIMALPTLPSTSSPLTHDQGERCQYIPTTGESKHNHVSILISEPFRCCQARYRLTHNPPPPFEASLVAKFIDASASLASASSASSANPLLPSPGLSSTGCGGSGLNLPRFLSDEACEGQMFSICNLL